MFGLFKSANPTPPNPVGPGAVTSSHEEIDTASAVTPVPTAAEVFCSGGRPTLNEVHRGDAPAFKAIAKQMRRPAQINNVHGPAKSGKTTCVRQLFSGDSIISIHAREAQSVEEFWRAVLFKARGASKVCVERKAGKTSGTSLGIEVEMGASAFGVKGHLGAGIERTIDETSEVVTGAEFDTSLKSYAVNLLVAQRAIVVVDDFHALATSLQTSLLRELRLYTERNGTVVIISVPLTVARALAADHEMSKLVRTFELPAWTLDGLCEIGHKGLKALNVSVDRRTVRRIASLCHYNPMLFQEACYQLMVECQIEEQMPTLTQLVVTDDTIRTIFRRMASQSEQQYEGLAATKGPSTWKLKGGPLARRVSIYTLCVLASRSIGFNQELGVPRLIERIGSMVDVSMVPSVTQLVITNALKQMSSDMATVLQHNAPLEYDPETAKAYYLDPFFMLYAQWVMAPEVGEPEPSLR
jgi:hypothetical protein